jgi:hypothetical protein
VKEPQPHLRLRREQGKALWPTSLVSLAATLQPFLRPQMEQGKAPPAVVKGVRGRVEWGLAETGS